MTHFHISLFFHSHKMGKVLSNQVMRLDHNSYGVHFRSICYEHLFDFSYLRKVVFICKVNCNTVSAIGHREPLHTPWDVNPELQPNAHK